MIVTNCRNEAGQIRVYLGAKSSLECWNEPAEGERWTFHWDYAVAGNRLDAASIRQWAASVLLELAGDLNVPPADLADVPFQAIQALHTASTYEARRLPASRRHMPQHAFVASPPHVTQPIFSPEHNDHTKYQR